MATEAEIKMLVLGRSGLPFCSFKGCWVLGDHRSVMACKCPMKFWCRDHRERRAYCAECDTTGCEDCNFHKTLKGFGGDYYCPDDYPKKSCWDRGCNRPTAVIDPYMGPACI